MDTAETIFDILAEAQPRATVRTCRRCGITARESLEQAEPRCPEVTVGGHSFIDVPAGHVVCSSCAGVGGGYEGRHGDPQCEVLCGVCEGAGTVPAR